MIRAVLDTNTIVSGVGWGGPPGAVLDAALAGRYNTVTISRGPDDDRLIEAALAAHADVIVTVDQDLLTLGRVDQIKILTPRAFLDALQPDT